MNQLSSHMASVFHYTTQLPIQSLHCQFDLPVAKPVWYVHLLSCLYPTCRLLTNLFYCYISEVVCSLQDWFRCLDWLWLQQQTFLSYHLSFPVKLLSFLCFWSLTFQSNGNILALLSRFLYNLVSVISPCSFPSSSVFFSWYFFFFFFTLVLNF